MQLQWLHIAPAWLGWPRHAAALHLVETAVYESIITLLCLYKYGLLMLLYKVWLIYVPPPKQVFEQLTEIDGSALSIKNYIQPPSLYHYA